MRVYERLLPENMTVPAKGKEIRVLMKPDSNLRRLVTCITTPDPLAATSELSVVLAIACVRVAQRPQLCRRLGGEGVATQAVEVRVPERGQPGDSLVAHGLAAAAQALDDGVEVTGIPQHDGVEDQAEGGELMFLAFAVGLPDLAAVAVADLAAEAVAGFLHGELPVH